MGKNVVGVYTSSFEAVKAIHSMRQDGIERKHICVLSNDDYGANIIEEKTGVDVEHDFNSSLEKRHLWKDLKSIFSAESKSHSGCSDYLLEIGMSESEAEQYAGEVEVGKFLVLVDSEYGRQRRGGFLTGNMMEPSTNVLETNSRSERVKEYEEEDDPFYRH